MIHFHAKRLKKNIAKKENKMKKIFAFIISLGIFLVSSCSGKKSPSNTLAVFAPGILADSPIYEMLANGAKEAVEEYNARTNTTEQKNIEIIEAGTNQAEWGAKLTALCAEGKYEVIITSNPSMPELVEPLTKSFPTQKFIILDAEKSGNQNIATVCYNQHEQGFLTGYIAGLMTKTKKIGLIAAQEYPAMNKIILPSFIEGAKTVSDLITVDFRIVGNWYSAAKGEELADAMSKSEVDVILPICGGAAQGVISSAKANGTMLAWFDSNGFARAPKNVIASTITNQNLMAKQMTLQFLEGKIQWGTAKTVGVKEGFIEFVQDDPIYLQNVPESVQKKMANIVNQLKTGILVLE